MNRKELIEFVAKENKTTKTAAADALAAVIAGIRSAVVRGDDVQLVGFGTFKVSIREARTGRNPTNGATIKIAKAKRVAFRAGSALKADMNKPKAAAKKK